MAEDATPGASGLLFGGRGAQAAADALSRTLTRLDQSVSRAVPVFDTLGKMGTGFRQGQSWNRGSNWVGTNGGGATFSGQPAGSHRADMPTQYRVSGTGYQPDHAASPLQGQQLSRAGAVAGCHRIETSHRCDHQDGQRARAAMPGGGRVGLQTSATTKRRAAVTARRTAR